MTQTQKYLFIRHTWKLLLSIRYWLSPQRNDTWMYSRISSLPHEQNKEIVRIDNYSLSMNTRVVCSFAANVKCRVIQITNPPDLQRQTDVNGTSGLIQIEKRKDPWALIVVCFVLSRDDKWRKRQNVMSVFCFEEKTIRTRATRNIILCAGSDACSIQNWKNEMGEMPQEQVRNVGEITSIISKLVRCNVLAQLAPHFPQLTSQWHCTNKKCSKRKIVS